MNALHIVSVAAAAMLATAGVPAIAQVQLSLGASHVSHQEASPDARHWTGIGPSATGVVTWHRWRAVVSAHHTSLQPESGSAGAAFTASRVDLRIGRGIGPAVLEVGAVGQSVSPDFEAQGFGGINVAMSLETRLSSHGRVWANVAYFPVVRFTGGGTSPFATGLGFGAEADLWRRLQLRVEYDQVRFDRTANDADVPVAQGIARLALGWRGFSL